MNPRSSGADFPVYLLFSLTGIGLVLPGTLLPRLAANWGGSDGRSGLFFFLFFLGASLGAFAARGRLRNTMALATFSIIVPMALLDRLRGVPALLTLLLYGFGLGLAMTSISLLQSRRRASDRRTALTRLNLVWAIGACAGPVLLLRASSTWGTGTTLRWYGGAVALNGIVVIPSLWKDLVPPSGVWSAWRRVRDLPPFYAVCLPLVTGIEAAVGGWITTHATRNYHAAGTVISAATALWAGVLLSRLVFSRKQSVRAEQVWAMPSLALLVVLGLALLLIGRLPLLEVGGAFCVGFGIGPLYPYLLSRLLDRGEAGNAGFLAAGAGSAVMPLLLGEVSQVSHSLTLGLLVPAGGAVVLAAAILLNAQNRVGVAAKDIV